MQGLEPRAQPARTGGRSMTSVVIQSERQFQAAVLDVARLQGWRVFHAHDSRRQIKPGVHVGDRDAAGFPDLVLCRPPRLLVAELKSARGRLRPEQREWLGLFEQLERVESYLWRPADWENVVEILR